MLYYRLYELSPNGKVCGVVNAHLLDDEAAVAFARKKHSGLQSELWNEGRHVATLTSSDGITYVQLFTPLAGAK